MCFKYYFPLPEWCLPKQDTFYTGKPPPEWKLTTVSVKVEITLVGVFIISLWWGRHVVTDMHWTALSHWISAPEMGHQSVKQGNQCFWRLNEDPKDNRYRTQTGLGRAAGLVCGIPEHTHNLWTFTHPNLSHWVTKPVNRVYLPFGRNFPWK